MTAIDKIIEIARNEIGYLEKNSIGFIYDKTANAGMGNYTKYWQEIKPEWQGQPWCAVFVTWCFVQAFGRENAERLLKHYPFTYVPQIAELFVKHANPKRGDIVCFYKNGVFAHTGLVTDVQGDTFYTVEGNTSGASGVIANGGGVCAKSYQNSKMTGTKFVRPDYSILTKELVTINDIVWELNTRGIIGNNELWLKKLESDVNAYWLARKTVNYIRNKETAY